MMKSVATVLLGFVLFTMTSIAQDTPCDAVVRVKVVALQQPWVANRLGTAAPDGQIYALRRNVTAKDTPIDANGNDIDPDALPLQPGNVRLKSHVRPRPLVLRVNAGECLEIEFENLFTTDTAVLDNNWAGIHVAGLELIDVNGQAGIMSDSSNVGANPNSVIQPGDQPITYKLYAREPGTYFAYNLASVGNVNNPSSLNLGLFGAVNVQPPGAEYYRSQVTRDDLVQATMKSARLKNRNLEPVLDKNNRPHIDADGYQAMIMHYEEDDESKQVEVKRKDGRLYSKMGQPLIDYGARYANGDPVLSMCDPASGDRELIYSDLTAIITGPNAGRFPYSTVIPEFYTNPASPDRRQPYREFTIIYHRANLTQAFNAFGFPDLSAAFCAGIDFFGINYGFGGIGAEILANRLGVGPEGYHGDGVDLKYEEFFLSSWAVGDPGMVVDTPANSVPTPSMDKPRATQVFYPDDPSNVYHSYLRDHLKFRIINADSGSPHVHHQHAHQWLHSPNSADGHYLDAQLITAGTTYTLEMVYNGSGNRNQTVGDSIFHCHFYPHFAGGMWSLWRVHDVYETGTILTDDGKVAPISEDLPWNRALPDGEIQSGTPIPALVPLPTLGMPPMPANVRVSTADDPTVPPVTAESLAGRRVIVEPEAPEDGLDGAPPTYQNPGYPFFIPAVAGHRPVHPPLDFAVTDAGVELNGGLPRHQVLGGTIVRDLWTRWDFTRDFVLFSSEEQKERTQETYLAGDLFAYQVPEDGTAVEKAAMQFHATRTFATYLPNGNPGNFTTNGLPPKPGAPFADPGVTDSGDSIGTPVRYKGANIQMDVVLNKKGWHYPQQRIVTLWEDVAPTISGARPPEPFFMRAETGDTVEFWHTNLVPNYYELDDFQVRTPTDILGQHIHLVKFDVIASDGATDGFNYEDATFSPDEVRERIIALNNNESGGTGGIYNFDATTQFAGTEKTTLTIQDYEDNYPFGPEPAYQNWDGAQTTVQRWDTDPLLNERGEDRTLRTVFTHDHLGPSTHQQVGLYAGLVVEPQGSHWFTNAPSYTAPGNYQVLGADGQLEILNTPTGEIPAGTKMGPGQRHDGGPTSWQAMIHTANVEDSYREFLVEFGDFQLSYTNRSRSERGAVIDDTDVSAVLLNVSLCESGVAEWQAGPVDDELKNRFCIAGIVLSDDAILIEGFPTDEPTAFHCEALIGVAENEVTWTVANRIMIDGTPTIVDWYPMVPFTCDADDDSCDFNNTFDCSTGDPISNPGCITASFKVYAPCTSPSWDDPNYALDTPGNALPAGTSLPGPTLISAPGGNRGTYSVNYRNEPIPYRVNANIDPDDINPFSDPRSVDLAYAFSSLSRLDADLNTQPDSGGPINPDNPDGFKFPQNPLNANISDYDPYTPLMNAYVGDKVQVRTLVGAHVKNHSFTMQGVKWFFEPSYTNSGYKSMQGMGISEHFEFLFDIPYTSVNEFGFSDFLYQPSSDTNGVTNGIWGMMRAYTEDPGLAGGGPPDVNFKSSLLKLPNNPNPEATEDGAVANRWREVIDRFENPPPPPFKRNADQQYDEKFLPENFRTFDVVATTAAQAYQDLFGITINSRYGINNPYGLIYVLKDDLAAADTPAGLRYVLQAGLKQEPLVLRANAGDWIRVQLENRLNQTALFTVDYTDYNTLSGDADDLDNQTVPADVAAAFADAGLPVSGQATVTVSGCAWILSDPSGQQKYTLLRKGQTTSGGYYMEVWPAGTPLSWVEAAGSPFSETDTPTVCLTASTDVGLNPQLLSYNMATSNGFNTGFNNVQTIGDGQATTYYWYAGNLETDSRGNLVETPVELGTINLRPTDPLIPHKNGLFAALIVEPIDTVWLEDEGTRASATIFAKGEESLLDRLLDLEPIGEPLFREFVVSYVEDLNSFTAALPADANYSASAAASFNYKAEPQSDRIDTSTDAEIYEWQSNAVTGGDDPETPVFYAIGGMEARVRILYTSGACPQVFMLNGHSWQEEPWIEDSTVMGHNDLSQQFGSVQILPNEPFNMVLPSAGGIEAVSGDYLLQTWLTDTAGSWGLIRVVPELVMLKSAAYGDNTLFIDGWSGSSSNGAAQAVELFGVFENHERIHLGAVEPDAAGRWQMEISLDQAPIAVRAETVPSPKAPVEHPAMQTRVIRLD